MTTDLGVEDVYELSPLQQGILYHCLASADPAAYAITLAVTLEGDLDPLVFREAWRLVARRTAALRTSLHWDGLEKPVQVVHREVDIPLDEHDARDWPEPEREERIARLAEAQHEQRLTLDRAPLARLSLVRTGERTRRLLWTFHHVLLEGWSASLVLQDVLAAHRALARGESPRLPDRVPYRAFIARLQEEDRGTTETFWREYLGGLEAPTRLDLPREAVRAEGRGPGTVRVTLSLEATAALQENARRHRLTLATVAQGAYALLLARYTDSPEVVFGNVASGRSIDLPGAESIVGLLVNTLPARVRVPRDERLSSWLQRVQSALHAAQRFEHASLVDIQGWSQVPRGTPLFDTLFAFENWASGIAAPGPASAELRLADVQVVEGASGYPLVVVVSPGPPLALTLRFDPERLGRRSVERLARHLSFLLEGMSRGLDGRVADLPLVGSGERELLVSGWNATRREYPRENGVHELFEEQARRAPEAPAVRSSGQALSYGELDRRANRIASRLRAAGIAPGQGVAICAERSVELVEGALGCLKAGAYYVPLDPAHPPARLAFMLADAGVSLVLTQEPLEPRLEDSPVRRMVLPLPEEAGAVTALPRARGSGDATAYVIYTSGSTGTPKGVAVAHRGLVNLVSWHCREYQVTPDARATLLASPGFDASVWELWPYLCAGAALEIPDEDTRTDPFRLNRWLAERAITHCFLPTPLAEAVLREPPAPGSALEWLLTGGDKLHALETPALPFTLVNHYGPTECTVVATAGVVAPGGDGEPAIGRPIDNTRAYVLDAELRPVPVGVPGELYVGGDGLARGYAGRPDLTAERFVPSPFGSGERLYRTGDVTRRREDGALEFLGRRDHQVKLRGFRVELGEIEKALLRHPSVSECAVLAREDRPDARRLAAYVVPRVLAGESADEAAPGLPALLRQRLQAELPDYMVPSVFVLLEELPLSPSGKIDRRALPEPDADLGPGAAAWPPRTPIEEALVEIWRDVLGREGLGIHESFFELGGHSLLATRVISLVRRTLGTDLPFRTLFDDPTIAGLARAVERARGGQETASPPPRRVPRGQELPLSFAQQRLWFLDQMGSGAAYNVPWSARLSGPLEAAALRESLADLVRRHEALRTTFPAPDGRPVQRVDPSANVSLVEADLSALPEAERESEARRRVDEEACRPFDLARGPLLRAMLLRLGDAEHVLTLTVHHIVTDGWSMGVLTRELAEYYSARRRGEVAELPELPVQYADFAQWQREWLQGEALESQLRYWRQRLGGDLPRLDLPADHPRPAVQTFRGGTRSIVLPARLVRKLGELCRDEGVTQFMALLAGFQALLHRYTGQEDLVVGSPIANRNRSEIEGLIGFFVNSLVMRTDVSGDPSFEELLARVREASLGAYDHQDLPFEKLVEELHPGRDLANNPLFQVVFAVQNAPWVPPALPDLEVSPFARETTATRFDLEVHVFGHAEGLVAHFVYNADLFEASTVERMSRQYVRLLESAVEGPGSRVSALSLVGEGEEAELLGLSRGSRRWFRRDWTIGEAFEAQVARCPEAVAVVFGEERLSYGELEARSNRLARHLRRRGVATGDRVGLCVERSLELVVGVLGIVKAGAAYVPLEPSYPRERLRFMVEDSRPSLVVTQSGLPEVASGGVAPAVSLDGDAEAIAREEAGRVESRVCAEDLAYVTYTSGSTGVPKGVEVRHLGVLRLVLGADYARLGPEEALLQLAPVSFDASTLELWGALLTGGRCVVYPERVPTAAELGEVLSREGVTTLWLTASLFNAVVDERAEVLSPVRQLLIGGEALSVEHVRRAQERLGQTQLINGYGPTEGTTFTCCHAIEEEPGEGRGSIPIGRPIANTDAFVLDGAMGLVPVGVMGELYVGGDGLARGYLNRPDLTAERFVPHPYAEGGGERLYRTGDKVRWESNGRLSFLGRVDDQVKLRGFRIELGEVESALRRHPALREAVALVRQGTAPGDRRLVAYVVPHAEKGDGGAAERDQRVAKWSDVYDSVIYDQIEAQGAAEETFNLAGWNSTYTGRPIPPEEMREQVEQAVERVLDGRPRRVLEIGCGTGLLLFRIAPHCARYVGTDFAAPALAYVRKRLHVLPATVEIDLRHARAEDFSGVEPGTFDAVVLNSVVQYFPDADYLRRVLQGALRALAPGGRLFVGDVRHLPLLETFAISVQLHQAPRALPAVQLRERVREHVAQEQELLVAPAFFVALAREAGASRVHVAPKRGRAINELTKYRYDAWLQIGGEPGADGPGVWLDWEDDGLSVGEISRMLAGEGPAELGVRRVRNARLGPDVLSAKRLASGDGPEPDGRPAPGVDPEDLWALAAQLPYRVDISWAAGHAEGRFDVLFRRRGDARPDLPTFPGTPEASRHGEEHTNDALRATRVRGLVPQLRRFLQDRLPEYMVPSAFVLLDALPLTPNGKVDHRSLLARELARPEVDGVFEAPRTPVEEELARIWAQVLGVPQVGIHDNFFELGGDSILSIQIIARAAQRGLHLTPKDVFQLQTVAELAGVAGRAAPVEAEQGVLTGEAPLTPIEHWFFEQELEDASHFNQAALLELRGDSSEEALREAALALEAHHDALRLRFSRDGRGWRQRIVAPAGGAFVRVDLSGVAPGEEKGRVERAAAELQASLDLSQGPIWRLALLDLGPSRPARVLAVVHHLAIDGVSWRILLEDLERAYDQARRGERVQLPSKTTSFRRWAERLHEYAGSAPLRGEIGYWSHAVADGTARLPLTVGTSENRVADAGTITVGLDTAETKALLQDAATAYRARAEDVLLAALARSLGRWTGGPLLVDLEGHGREDVFEGVDLSRTVGWFTCVYPVRLPATEGVGDAALLKSVKETLRAAPRRGLGYGVLRYLAGDDAAELRTGPGAEVSFNYLGQFDGTLAGLGLFKPATESPGPARSPRARRRHRLEVNALVAGGCLSVSFAYGRALDSGTAIERLAQGFLDDLRTLVSHLRSGEAGGHTPSDFPLAALDQAALDRLLGRGRDVEDVYPLSPLQEGLLFHSLLEPASTAYCEQLSLDLDGRIDTAALREAWQRVIDRHAVLRTRFAWDGLPRPLQIVQGRAALPWEEHDWRALDATERAARLEALVETDRARGFDLSRAPLVRVACARTGDERYRVVWSFHHAVLDGWSLPLVFRDLAVAYQALARGQEPQLGPARPYRDYLAWLARQDLASAEAYWRETLAGFRTPTPLPLDRGASFVHEPGALHREQTSALPAATTAALKALGREHQLTLSTLVQGALAVLLSRHSGSADVLFGVNVSGRPPALPGVESIVGLFVNTLPLRVRVDEDAPAIEWLSRLQAAQVGQRPYEFSPLVKVQAWGEVPGGRPLFESILAFENYPVDPEARQLGGGAELRYRGATNYPLSLTASAPGLRLTLRAVYDRRRFTDDAVARLLEQLGRLLEGLASHPRAPVAQIPLLTPGERQKLLVEWNDTHRPRGVPPTLHEELEAQVERTPDAVAVVFDGLELRYRELNERANQLAHVLRARGVGPDVLVGVFLERSVELVVALVAVLKAGGAYVPLDPGYPMGRLESMLDDAQAAVVLTARALADRLPAAASARALCLDADRAAIASQPSGNLASLSAADHLAYVIYTSGSTGRPKGVMISHRAIVNHMAWMQSAFPLGPRDRVLQKTPLSFDASVWEFYAPLLAGSRLVLAGPEGHRDAGAIVDAVLRHGITTLQLVPTLLRLLLEEPRVRECRSLSRVFCGGEALAPELVERFEARLDAGLHNLYGPTEATIDATVWSHERGAPIDGVPIGRPVDNTKAYLLDSRMRPVPVGAVGELYLGGEGLARGYWQRPDLTAAAFLPDPFADGPGGRLYRTGDRARYREDGQIEFLGRADHQVKLRGLRIELGEIEAALVAQPAVRAAAVAVREDAPGDARLVAYVVPRGATAPPDELRSALRQRLPEHMVPSQFVTLERLPLTPNGKVDRMRLPVPEGAPASSGSQSGRAPHGETERRVAAVWREVLRLDSVPADRSFFDLGGHSLLLLRAHGRLKQEFPGRDIAVVDLFRHPTVSALAAHLSPVEESGPVRLTPAERARARRDPDRGTIAIVGMAGRFPGARDVAELWSNLRRGVESVVFFGEAEMAAAGVPRALASDPRYVKARGVLDGVELFDAGFFGYSPREAEILDPQQRLFLESAWEALERAGCDPSRDPGLVGVFAGVGLNTYWLNLAANPLVLASLGGMAALIGGDKDHLPTRVSYKLDLRGPSVAVQTACSTSLVAVHLACQSLLLNECDVALAGGVAVALPQHAPYRYQEEGILSPDGHCRAFDAAARGTVAGGGVGVVVLKRLSDALRDGDTVDAVILGSAINNDGAGKVGYTAPGVEGQAGVIALAQAVAGVEPRSISYVEAHGTGTALGDPIEIEALCEVFRARTSDRGFCAIGSVKTNIGHLDAAAGVAGLIKTVLALKHRELPPSLHFERANPAIDFDSSPFFVNDRLRPWPEDRGRRRAGVSSFGIGGTNAHVVLEEAPPADEPAPAKPWQLLVWSAKSEAALDGATARLADHLEAEDQPLADVAYTLQTGRRSFAHRRFVVSRDREGASRALRGRDRRRVPAGVAERPEGGVAFLFPGQGTQYRAMGQGLYRDEPVFRRELDRCGEILRGDLGLDLRDVLFAPSTSSTGDGEERIRETALAQPALFAVEWALAALFVDRGVRPTALLGHSVGEYVAACLAGVFELEEALSLVAERGRLMSRAMPGAMLAVRLDEGELRPLLGTSLSLAAVNAPRQCVASGESSSVAALEARLGREGIECRRLATSHAFHSAMMDPVLPPFRERVARARLVPPRVPFLSNVTGDWIRDEQATDPEYWVRHLRETVRFADGLARLVSGPRRVLLEVGPGQALADLARELTGPGARSLAVASMPREGDADTEGPRLLEALGRVWVAGVDVEWARLWPGEQRRRVPLPTYPFQRQRYWLDAPAAGSAAAADLGRADLADWFHMPSWSRRAPSPATPGGNGTAAGARWLLLADGCGLGARLADRLRGRGDHVISVTPDGAFAKRGRGAYTVGPANADDFEALVGDLEATGTLPTRVVHLWGVTPRGAGFDTLEQAEERCFHSLVFLARALGGRGAADASLAVVTSHMQEVSGEGPCVPEKALVLGPCRVIPDEYPRLPCRSVDVLVPDAGQWSDGEADRLLAELEHGKEPVVALRGIDRWVQGFEPLRLEGRPGVPARLRPRGHYLVTGGTAGIGLALAGHLARTTQARLSLVARSRFPGREEWPALAAGRGADGERARSLLELEGLGAEVIVLRADVSLRDEMARALLAAEQRFGEVHGVIHAAGVPGGGVIALKTREAAERVLAPKLRGGLLLDELFRGRRPDFIVLCSSLASVLGGAGQVDYVAGNAFLDALARRNTSGGGPFTVSIGFDAWSETGMAVAAELPPDLAEARRRSLAYGVRTGEGVEAFDRILDQELPHVVTSTVPLEARRRARSTAAGSESGVKAVAVRGHERPALAGECVAPRDELEEVIADLWQEMLGFEALGVHDDFFELGGHSLLATRIVNRLRESFPVALRLETLFEAPTVAGLASAIQEKEPRAREIARVLMEVERLSPDELGARLGDGAARVEGA